MWCTRLLALELLALSPLCQGLLNKKPGDRLGWPELLDHPFVRESAEEQLKREKALADAVELADASRAWKVRAGGNRRPGCVCCLQL